MYEQQQQQQLDRLLLEGNKDLYPYPSIPLPRLHHENPGFSESSHKKLIIEGDTWNDTAVIQKLKSGTIEHLRLDKSPNVTTNIRKAIEQYGSNIKILEVLDDCDIIQDQDALVALMMKLPKLEELNMVSLDYIEDSFFPLLETLGDVRCHQIKRLQLESCTNEDLDHTKLLDNCATYLPELQVLSLVDFWEITREEVDRVITDTKLLPDLQLLILHGANMEEYDLEDIKALKKLRKGKLNFVY
jgi:hypothetical protein